MRFELFFTLTIHQNHNFGFLFKRQNLFIHDIQSFFFVIHHNDL